MWVAFATTLLFQCNSRPTREWRATDHDQPSQPAASNTPNAQESDSQKLVEAAWRTHCLTCHGFVGKGDGPSGPMMRASDLTREDWQKKVTDEEIANVIRNGRNRMPAFQALPNSVVQGLIARIRSTQGK